MEQIATKKRSYIPLILDRLKSLEIDKVILFGSLTSGNIQLDSDIDLIVVTKDDFLPQSYREKSEIFLRVSNVLTDITAEIPIDLIVYTKPMYERFKALGSLFSKEITKKGVVLYEADN